MPQDSNGTTLAVGDEVTFRGKVVSLDDEARPHNMLVQLDGPADVEYKPQVFCNSKLCTKS